MRLKVQVMWVLRKKEACESERKQQGRGWADAACWASISADLWARKPPVAICSYDVHRNKLFLCIPRKQARLDLKNTLDCVISYFHKGYNKEPKYWLSAQAKKPYSSVYSQICNIKHRWPEVPHFTYTRVSTQVKLCVFSFRQWMLKLHLLLKLV